MQLNTLHSIAQEHGGHKAREKHVGLPPKSSTLSTLNKRVDTKSHVSFPGPGLQVSLTAVLWGGGPVGEDSASEGPMSEGALGNGAGRGWGWGTEQL